jgi:hypothetical protein
MGSANYASAKADSCPLVQRNYGIRDNKEPEDAREQGSFKDILGGIGDAITGGLDTGKDFPDAASMFNLAGLARTS